MTKKIKIHDGIIAVLLLASSALTYFVDGRFVALVALTALIMLSSTVTGFCPVHFTVGKLVKDER
jgi:hypothetical protein